MLRPTWQSTLYGAMAFLEHLEGLTIQAEIRVEGAAGDQPARRYLCLSVHRVDPAAAPDARGIRPSRRLGRMEVEL